VSRDLAAAARGARPRTVLAGLAVIAIVVAIVTPEARQQGGGSSSYSTAAGGTSIAFEHAQRMGWRVLRRERALDSAAGAPSVQVVINPRQALGRHEVHRLLENVRGGGGLVFTLAANDEIADSLGVAIRIHGRLLLDMNDRSCVRARSIGSVGAIPPTVYEVVWRRPPPGPVTSLMRAGAAGDFAPVAVGFPLGRGRVVVVAGDDVFENQALWNCEWGADVLVARAWEYVRRGTEGQPLVFDEFHHGRGVHPGSISAVATYLSRVASGRFFATLLAAGVLLLFAMSPRPIIPREPERILRRSPLEHADALGRAYADVGATRTAVARLVSGLRRRAGRAVGAGPSADDAAFLEVIGRRFPSLASQVALLQGGLRRQISPREFALSADAIEEIERVVSTSPSIKA
jgi:hypothetical protein